MGVVEHEPASCACKLLDCLKGRHGCFRLQILEDPFSYDQGPGTCAEAAFRKPFTDRLLLEIDCHERNAGRNSDPPGLVLTELRILGCGSIQLEHFQSPFT